MKRLILIVGLCLLPVLAFAQGGSTNIRATDTSTGASTQVGDNTNHALRTNCVSGCAGGTQDVEDGTVSGGQTTGIQIDLNQVWDGSNWKRFTVGTAGSAASQVLTVQGIASGTAISVQPGGTMSTGNGVSGSGVQRVTLASDSTGKLLIWDGTDTLQIDGSGNLGVTGTVAVSSIGPGSQIVGKVGIDQTTDGTTNLVASKQSGTWSITCTNCSGTGVAVNEDVASANADPGTPAYAVRADAPAGATSADGDYQPLKSDSIGRLWVNCGTGCSGGTQFAEDAASANADVGTLAMARRTATPANTSGTDLDYETLQMNAGRLWVDASGVTLTVGSHAVTNAGTFAVQESGAALTSLQLIDDIIRSEDAASADAHAGASVLTVRQDTPAGSTSADGDYQPFKTDSIGRLWINCGTGCSGGTQYTEDAASAGAESLFLIGGVRRDTTPSSSSGTAGDYSNFILDGNGRLYTQTVLYNSSGTELTPSQDQTLDSPTGSTGPLMMGKGSTATLTAMSADGDATALWLDLNGRIHVTSEGIEDAAETAATFLSMAGSVRRDTAASSAGTTGDNATINTDSLGKLWVSGAFAEDAAHSSSDIGLFVLTKRTDAAATSAGTDGDYATLNTDASGRLWVNCGTGCSGGTQFAEDAASVSADVGTIALVVRQDTPAGSTSTDGDYTTLKSDSVGRLWVNCATGCSGGSQVQEDNASANADTGTIAFAIRDDTLDARSGTEGDFEYLHTNANGALWTIDVNSAALLTSNQLQDDVVMIEDAAETAGGAGILAFSVRRDTAASSAGTTGDNATINTDANGRLWVTESALGTEDAAASADNPLMMMGAVRQDNGSARAGTSGDNINLTTDQYGHLWISGGYQEDAAHTSADPGTFVLALRTDTAAASAGTTGDYAALNTDALGLLWTRHLDPCDGTAKTAVPFSFSTATTTQLVAASASNKVYVCSINIVSAAANNVALIEDDTAACASPTAGMAGGTTAATGWNLAANGGLTLGNGAGSVAISAATNRYVCLINSAATQTSGTLVYALAP